MTDKPLLIVFIGPPGSGKTYFGTRLAEKISAVRLSSDAMRVAMFGSQENVDKIQQSADASILYSQVFGVADYVAKQILQAGYSVMIDAQATKRRDRRKMEVIAQEYGALPLLILVEVPPEVAITRGQTREARDDSIRYDEAKMRMLVDRFTQAIELPDASEHLIKIDGQAPFEAQYASFQNQLTRL